MNPPPTGYPTGLGGSHDEYPQLVAGQALGALDPPDERRLAEHLAGCAACRQLLADLTDTAGELAGLAAHPTPAGLDAAVRDAVRRPPARALPLDRARRERARPDRARKGWAPLAAAAALLLVAAGLAVWQSGGSGSTRTDLASTAAALRCEQEPGCEPVLLSDGQGTTRAVALLRATQARLLVDGLPANRADEEIYVLWQVRPGSSSIRAIGTFDVPMDADGVVGPFDLAVPPAGDAQFAVSREPGRIAPAQPSSVLLRSTSS